MSRWCYWHIRTKENPEGTDCTAHMAEGRVFKCPYRNLQDSQLQRYPCGDALVGAEMDQRESKQVIDLAYQALALGGDAEAAIQAIERWKKDRGEEVLVL